MLETIIDSTCKTDEEFMSFSRLKSEEHYKINSDKNEYLNKQNSEDIDSFEKEKYERLYKEKDRESKRMEYYNRIISGSFDDFGNYKLNNLIDNVIKKIEFLDKFNFDNA